MANPTSACFLAMTLLLAASTMDASRVGHGLRIEIGATCHESDEKLYYCLARGRGCIGGSKESHLASARQTCEHRHKHFLSLGGACTFCDFGDRRRNDLAYGGKYWMNYCVGDASNCDLDPEVKEARRAAQKKLREERVWYKWDLASAECQARVKSPSHKLREFTCVRDSLRETFYVLDYRDGCGTGPIHSDPKQPEGDTKSGKENVYAASFAAWPQNTALIPGALPGDRNVGTFEALPGVCCETTLRGGCSDLYMYNHNRITAACEQRRAIMVTVTERRACLTGGPGKNGRLYGSHN